MILLIYICISNLCRVRRCKVNLDGSFNEGPRVKATVKSPDGSSDSENDSQRVAARKALLKKAASAPKVPPPLIFN